jgi:beta-glucosidase-like glycosyl hydrolase
MKIARKFSIFNFQFSISALLALTLTMCASAPPKKQQIPRLEDLSTDEKVGQLFVAAGHGNYTNESGWRYRDLIHHVRDNKVGGLIWFVSNVYETAFLTQQLQSASRVPMLISADLEAGIGMRFLDTTFWPSAMAVAATGDPQYAETLGRITAVEAKTLGINHILAPVADVNVNPANPVINTRSYGEDPADVGRFVAAFIRGVQSEGVLATAKHFPGHGDTHVDSHRSLPRLDVSAERLRAVELPPFRAAVEANVASIMVGHLAVPALDPTPAPVRVLEESSVENPYGTAQAEIQLKGTVPATLSEKMIVGLLRNELGFRGLVVSDAMDMGGLVAHYDAGEAAVLGILAGEDQILKSPNVDAAVVAVKEAVRTGRIPMSRLDESVRRILDAKARVGYRVATQEEIFRTIDSQKHRDAATQIATHAVTMLREEPALLPLRKDLRIVILVISDFPELANPLADVERSILRRVSVRPRTFLIDSRARAEDTNEALDVARTADLVLLALAVRARSGAGHLAIPDVARDLISRIPPEVETIAASFGSPYIVRDLPNIKTYLCAYGIQPVMQQAVVAALFGEAPVTGKLPVTIPGLHKRGEGIEKR